MNATVTLVMCYRSGTADMARVWFESVHRHTKDVPYKVVVLAKQGDFDKDMMGMMFDVWCAVPVEVEVGDDEVSRSRMHGKMLDTYVPYKVETEYVATMDTDCFPVADGWLSGLLGMMDKGHTVAGILHPWGPPPQDMKRSKIEWRVRSQHCWENTHVACQVTRTAELADLGVKFAGGDDTGLLVPKMARERGWTVTGYKATRCPKPAVGKVDPEFNRYVGLVYGDKVFHLGGYTRIAGGDEPVFKDDFGWVTDRVLKDGGAEFLLDDAASYRFKFDREEAVAAEKMQRLFGWRDRRMG